MTDSPSDAPALLTADERPTLKTIAAATGLAIATVSRRRNHFPTIARLTTDSALWPKPRVSVTKISRPITEDSEKPLCVIHKASSGGLVGCPFRCVQCSSGSGF